MNNGYVEELNKIERSNKLHSVHWLIIFLSTTATISAWYITKSQIEEKTKIKFEKEAAQVIELISDRMARYEDALWSGVSTIYVNGGDIDTHKWKVFADTFKIDIKYPGINGIGVIHNVKPSEMSSYLKNQRKYRTNYKVHPKHNRSDFWPITYIEPVSRNAKAVGLDMAHELNRYTAALKSRDTAQAQITGPIVLVQDSEKTPGFLFYAPFYEGGNPEGLIERREKVRGLVYAPFVFKRLMLGVLDQKRRTIGVKITDEGFTLYNENRSSNEQFDENANYTMKNEVEMYGRKWNYDIRATKAFTQTNANNQPLLILIGGIIIDLLLFILFLSLSRMNKKILSYGHKVNVGYLDKTKDIEKMNKKLQKEIEHRKVLEQNRDSINLSKSIFISRTNDKVKVPLDNSLSHINDLLESLQDSNLINSARNIKKSILSLREIVNGVTEYSSLESKPQEINYSVVNLKKLVTGVISRYEPYAIDKGLKIINSHSNTVPSKVKVDAQKLEKILCALMENAIKFTSRGKVEVMVSAQKKSLDDIFALRFEIIDTGVGIAYIHNESIFDPFVQIENEELENTHGAGLSLSIASNLALLLKGQITVESELGVGSSFVLTLPVDSSTLDEKDIKNSKSNVVIFERNLQQQMEMAKILHLIGYERVEVASNESEFYNKCKTQGFDIVLMGVNTSLESDMAIVVKTRETLGDFLLTGPAIVVVTDEKQTQDQGKSIYTHIEALTSKPVGTIELQSILNRLEEMIEKRNEDA